MLTYEEKCVLAKAAQPGDVWVSEATKRTVVITGRSGYKGLVLKHETGRETTKQEHYFAYDYSPYTGEKESLPPVVDLQAARKQKQACMLAAKPNDVWCNKDGKEVTIISRKGGVVTLRHASGKVTEKKEHYFSEEYSPKESVGAK